MSKNGISAGWCALLYAVALVSLVSTARAQGSSEMQDLTLGTPGTGQFVVGYDSTDTGDDPAGTAKRYAFPPPAWAMTGQSLTGSQSTSLLDLTTTWNTTGTPTALKLNVTDTASDASSLLMDLQVVGTSKFKVTKSGAVTVANIDAAGDLYLKNSTTATQGRIYNTYTDASNGEWLSLDWATTNIATIATTGNGTGAVTPRALRLESLGGRLLHQTGDSSNTFLGNSSGNYSVSGSNNTGAGYNTLASVTSGILNSAFGGGALDVETTGSYNTAVGVGSLGGQNGATYNTAMGRGAGLLLSTGSHNSILGALAGDNLTTGASNIILGYDIDAQSATASGQISIGNLIFGTAVGTGTTASTGNVGIGVAAPAAKLDVAGDSIFGDNANGIAIRFHDSHGGSVNAGIGSLSSNSSVKGLAFYVANTTENEAMRINYLGNVGIGTASPGSKLDVAGGVALRDRSAMTATAAQSKIWSQSGEMKVIDAAGNITTISPHPQELMDVLGVTGAAKTLGMDYTTPGSGLAVAQPKARWLEWYVEIDHATGSWTKRGFTGDAIESGQSNDLIK